MPKISPQKDVEAELEKRLLQSKPDLFNGISGTKKHAILSAIQKGLQIKVTNTHVEAFSGPFPHPGTLEGYKNIDPSLPDKIIKMAIDEQTHSHQRDNKIIALEFGCKKRAQWFAFLISIIVTGCGLAAILTGHDIAGTVFGGLGLSTLVGLFLKEIFSKK